MSVRYDSFMDVDLSWQNEPMNKRMELNLGVFKFPLGFVRILQFLFIVIAIAAANSWRTEVTFECTDAVTNKTSLVTRTTNTFSMQPHELQGCDNKEHPFWKESWGGAAGFFYFTNVVALIFCLIVTFAYVVFWPIYQQDKRIALADLAVTALLFVFFFFCTSIWWAAANGIGRETDLEHVKSLASEKPELWGTVKEVSVNNGMLAISVLCGWVCVMTFALNCWFIWKEVVPRTEANPTQVA